MNPEARAAINQENARYSTGPKTIQGKKRSSRNALRHGLTGQTVVIPTDDLDAYQRRLQCYTDEYQPVGATEEDLVQSLADTAWRLNRVATLETKLLASGADLESQSKALSNLSLHSQRLSRQFEKTVNQLRDLQNIRKPQEHHDLDNLLDIMQMYEDKGETYDPSEDGFVFSEHQINETILRRNREILIDQAFDHRDAKVA